MQVELEHVDIVQLIKGIGPGDYESMARCGRFGKTTMGPSWSWSTEELKSATEKELWELYQLLKKHAHPGFLY